MKYLAHVRNFELVRPGPRALSVMAERLNRGTRYGRLSDLQVINGMCKWCEENSIPNKGRFRFYCGKNCSESSGVWMNPQKPTAKAWLLINRQSGACARCKEDLGLDDHIWKKLTYWIDDLKVRPITPDDKVELFSVAVGTGHLWQVDHIVPIHKGGESLGLDNVQVLCVGCHARKTVEDRRPGKKPPIESELETGDPV